MSQSQPSTAEPERQITKTVQVAAYLTDQSYDSWREYVDDHDEDTDYFEKTHSERVNYFLTGFGEEIPIDEEQYVKFRDNNIGNMSLKKESDSSEYWRHNPRDYVKSVAGVICDSMADGLEGFDNKTYWRTKFEHESRDTKITVMSHTRKMGMLKHSSEATKNDLWENQENLMAMLFKIKISDASPGIVDYFDEVFVRGFIKTLSQSDEIAQIRMYDCESETTETGVCVSL